MVSLIRDFYKAKSIFVTGGTGLVGTLTIEKLLRCCDVKEIFVLIRGKKQQSAQERIQMLCEDEVFNRVRKVKPDFARKIVGINGDCGLQGLGMSLEDRQRLRKNANVVFHSGALVAMDADLKDALNINSDGTQRIIDLCREMEQLQVFQYVSTWFSNNNQPRIDEKIYDPQYSLDQLKQLSEHEQIRISKELVNSYCFSKNLAEYTISKSSDLPSVIVRPPVVIPTREEPFAGWTNNVWGATGIAVSAGMGIWKIFGANPAMHMPLIPADMFINQMLATAWDTAVNRKPKEIPIYNCISDRSKMIRIKEYYDENYEASKDFPPLQTFGPIEPLKIIKNTYWFSVMWFLYHTVPATVADAVLVMQGKKPKLRKIYGKIGKVQKNFHPLCLDPPDWGNDNTKALWEKLTPTDKETFNFDYNSLDWAPYIHRAFEGMRYFVYKDDPRTIPDAKKRQEKLRKKKLF